MTWWEPWTTDPQDIAFLPIHGSILQYLDSSLRFQNVTKLIIGVCFCFKGVVKTQIWKNNKWSERLLRPFMRSAENGAMTTLYVATHPDIEEQNRRGCYFVPSKTIPPPYCRPALGQMNPVAEDREQCRLLWELSQRLTKLNTTI